MGKSGDRDQTTCCSSFSQAHIWMWFKVMLEHTIHRERAQRVYHAMYEVHSEGSTKTAIGILWRGSLFLLIIDKILTGSFSSPFSSLKHMVIHLVLISQLSALSLSQAWREVAGAKNRKSCLLSNWQRESRVSSSVSCFKELQLRLPLFHWGLTSISLLPTNPSFAK